MRLSAQPGRVGSDHINEGPVASSFAVTRRRSPDGQDEVIPSYCVAEPLGYDVDRRPPPGYLVAGKEKWLVSMMTFVRMRPAPGLIGAEDVHSLPGEPSRREAGAATGGHPQQILSLERMWLPHSAVQLPSKSALHYTLCLTISPPDNLSSSDRTAGQT